MAAAPAAAAGAPAATGVDGVEATAAAAIARVQKKMVVAIDMDDVLGEFVPALCDFHARAYPDEPKHSVETFHSYRFAPVWQCSDDESSRKVAEFFDSPEFAHPNPKPLPHSQAVLQRLHATGRFDFVVVTSRQLTLEKRTRDWLAHHHAGVFRDAVFGNHYGATGAKKKKSELCAALGARVLIDDSLVYAMDCACAHLPKPAALATATGTATAAGTTSAGAAAASTTAVAGSAAADAKASDHLPFTTAAAHDAAAVAAAAGADHSHAMHVLLYDHSGRYAWNALGATDARHVTALPHNVTRCTDWHSVEQRLHALYDLLHADAPKATPAAAAASATKQSDAAPAVAAAAPAQPASS